MRYWGKTLNFSKNYHEKYFVFSIACEPYWNTHTLTRCLQKQFLLIFFTALAINGKLFSQSFLPTSISLDVAISTVNPVPNCTNVKLVFTFTNTNDEPVSGIDLDAILFPTLTVTNPFGFFANGTLIPAPNGTDPYNRWTMANLTVPGLDDPEEGILQAFLTFQSPSFLPNNPEEVYYRGCFQTNCDTPIPFVNLIPDNSFVEIGLDQNSVSFISIEATGQTGDLVLPAQSPSAQQDVLIHGTLIVDVNYSFPSFSNLYIADGGTIKVNQPNRLDILDQTKVQGCAEMWQGFEVMGGATLAIDGSTGISQMVEILDATTAVLVHDDATVNVNNTHFKDNNVGIASPATGGPIDADLTVTDNIFEGTVFGLNPPLSGKPLAGVWANNLADPLILLDNVYRGMSMGISADHSSIFSSGETFEDLDIGIKTVSDADHFLFQIGKGQTSGDPTFTDCGTGIFAENVSVGSEDNLMEGVGIGYSLLRGTFKNTQIHDNTINASLFGMAVTQWQPIDFYVDNNTINIDGDPTFGAGIRAFQLIGQLIGTPATFTNNEINLSSARHGVLSTNSGIAAYQDNTINMLNPQQYDGFEFNGGGINLLDCNAITGTDTQNEQAAITFSQSFYSFIDCNATDDTRQGIHILGQNNPTSMKGNAFGDHFHGLMIGDPNFTNSPGGVTGLQNHNGNRWTGTYSNGTEGAGYYGNSQFEILQSRHKVNTGDGLDLKTDEPLGQTSLFIDVPGSTFTFLCPGSCPPPTNSPFGNGGISETDIRIADGTLTPSGYVTEQVWTSKRQLYRRLLDDPMLLQQATEITTFYNAEASTTVGQFETTGQGMDALFELDGATFAQMQANLLAIETKAGELLQVERQLANDPTPQEEANLLAQKATAQQDIANTAAAQGAQNTALDASRISSAGQLLSSNASILTTTSYELNQKEYNRVAGNGRERPGHARPGPRSHPQEHRQPVPILRRQGGLSGEGAAW